MKINFDKTIYMVLGIRDLLQDAQFLNLIIDNHNVIHVSQQKLLGLHIDDIYISQAIPIYSIS